MGFPYAEYSRWLSCPPSMLSTYGRPWVATWIRSPAELVSTTEGVPPAFPVRPFFQPGAAFTTSSKRPVRSVKAARSLKSALSAVVLMNFPLNSL